jgi:hypothetical protein
MDLTSQERVDEDIRLVVEELGRVSNAGRSRVWESSGKRLDVVAEEELGGRVECEPRNQVLKEKGKWLENGLPVGFPICSYLKIDGVAFS